MPDTETRKLEAIRDGLPNPWTVARASDLVRSNSMTMMVLAGLLGSFMGVWWKRRNSAAGRQR
ncbi:MAG: hypothetical protein ACR2OZ_15295 [Verrucomicrobiales bacterium]